MDHLLRITHHWWIYRNYKIHYKSVRGLTLKEHDEIFERMGELMYTDPDELLPQHQHPLVVSKERLEQAALSERQTWITRVEAAVSAKERLKRDIEEVEGDAQNVEAAGNRTGNGSQKQQQV